MARDETYGKACETLTSEVADLDADQQRIWTDTLLPKSDHDESRSYIAPIEQTTTSNERIFRRTLDGVRFPALSAAGPSGTRPDHIREMLAIPRKSEANRLYRAILALRTKGEDGTLPESARWILGSRLVFIKKKKGPKPRPIRVGEVWRRIIAKALIHDNRDELGQVMLYVRQFGVSIPHGAESLVHFRQVFQELLPEHADHILTILDLDLVNAFPSFEWKVIDEAVSVRMPEFRSWIQ